ncbi:MAG: type VII secretion protein EccCa [Rhodococcus sp. (in: high G+C Gram-positive bacteria)]
MSTKLVHRPARLSDQSLPRDRQSIAKVPTIDMVGGGGQNVMRALVPVVGGLGLVAMMASSGNPIRMIAGGALVVAAILGAIAMIVYAKTGARKRAEQQRGQYIRFISAKRTELEAESAQQVRVANDIHPPPPALLDIVRTPARLWERRRTDADFLTLRIGSGAGPLCRTVAVDTSDDDPMKRPEPIAQAHLRRYLRATEHIDGLPMAVQFRGVVSFVGPADLTHRAVRAALVQLAALHAPDDVRLHIALPRAGGNGRYQWALWLPHLLDADRFDGPLGRRRTSREMADATDLVDEIAKRRAELGESSRRYAKDKSVEGHTIVVIADNDDPHGRELLSVLPAPDDLRALAVVVVVLNTDRDFEPSHVDVRVSISDDASAEVTIVHDLDGSAPGRPLDDAAVRERRLVRGASRGTIDRVEFPLAAAVARKLAPVRLVADAAPTAPLEATITLDRLLGIADVGTYDVEAMWTPRSLDDFLNVPFAVGPDGSPIRLNLKESAQEGMGPHGLCVGATGSGKSEVLRTMVLSQAICHSPDRLALVLVDYKGGAAFAGLDQLPHTAAMVDNLSDGTGLVDRLHDALLGEMRRRQRVLQEAGSLPNVTEYNRRRDAGQALDPLPDLLVVIDEFGEILTAKPDFIDLFVQIGRIGRSIGVHLLLATQRLEEGRLRGLESHLSYRIGLRTFSAQESRAAIGEKDAHELPPIPGSGILKVDPDIFDRFKAAYVSGRYVPSEEVEDTTLPAVPMPFDLDNGTAHWLQANSIHRRTHAASAPDDSPFGDSTLDVVARRLGGYAQQVRQVWLPPLPDAVGLSTVVGDVEADAVRGLTARDRSRCGGLRFPVGLSDRPLEQWQGPLDIDLSGSGGHLAIMGAPQSGKTSAVRSLVLGAALTHTPDEVAFYVIDTAGSVLASLAALPHVGDVATRFESDKIRRTLSEISAHLTARERIFSEHGLESVEAMRSMRAAGSLPEIPHGDIFLVIDGWWTFREENDDLVATIQDIASRGLGYGIHMVFTTGRWADFRMQMQALIGSKIELRLNDALDSTLGRRLVESIGPDTPGRCVSMDKLLGQICLPVYSLSVQDELSTPDSTLAAVAKAWTGSGAAPVRMLPDAVPLSALRREFPHFPHGLVGVSESDLMPVRLDLMGDDQHLVVLGDGGSGKTTFARALITDMCPHFEEGELVFAVFDPKRQLMDVVPRKYIGGYAGTSNVAAQLVASITQEIVRRLPPATVTSAQLRDRSWWTGPEVVIVCDDYELWEGPNSPLRPLLPYLSQSRDLGVHIVIVRRAAGIGRALFEPSIQGLKDAGATAVLLSGDRQEGQVWPKVWMSRQPPGRADVVRRGASPRRVQLAYLPTDRDI